WKKFSNEERQIVYRIWNYIGETAKKQYQIDALIDRQRREMDEKIQIKERIHDRNFLHSKQYYLFI
ncbi:unnamed protein product, partial [Rotaria sp. Silwood1]